MADLNEAYFIDITDEEGNSYRLELLDTFIMGESTYLACIPEDMDENDPDYGVVIVRQYEDETGELYIEVPDDDEAERAYDEYMRRLYDEWEDDEQ